MESYKEMFENKIEKLERKPLGINKICKLWEKTDNEGHSDIVYFARLIENAHGIGVDND